MGQSQSQQAHVVKLDAEDVLERCFGEASHDARGLGGWPDAPF